MDFSAISSTGTQPDVVLTFLRSASLADSLAGYLAAGVLVLSLMPTESFEAVLFLGAGLTGEGEGDFGFDLAFLGVVVAFGDLSGTVSGFFEDFFDGGTGA